MSNQLLKILLGSAVLACAAGGVVHAAEKDIAETPLGLEFKRGNDAADECGGMKMLKATPTSYGSYLDALLDKLHKQSGNLAHLTQASGSLRGFRSMTRSVRTRGLTA